MASSVGKLSYWLKQIAVYLLPQLDLAGCTADFSVLNVHVYPILRELARISHSATRLPDDRIKARASMPRCAA